MEPEREITKVWQDNPIICHSEFRRFGDQIPTFFYCLLLLITYYLSVFN